jgi:hypothetical protein
MNDVVCTVCGRTVTVDENTTTCPSCGAPLALPVQQEPAAVAADSAGPAVRAGDPTDSAEVQAIPVADVAGEGPAEASGVRVDMSAATPDVREAAGESEFVAVEATEVLPPTSNASDAFVVAYASDGGSRNGAGTYATADTFEPVAVAYETVSYEAPTSDAYVPPVPVATDGGFGAADASADPSEDAGDAAADSTDAGL